MYGEINSLLLANDLNSDQGQLAVIVASISVVSTHAWQLNSMTRRIDASRRHSTSINEYYDP